MLYSTSSTYEDDFEPLPLKRQLADIERGEIFLTEVERKQGRSIVDAFTEVVTQLINRGPVLLGVGMPGIKTADDQGIAAMANGPRIPHFCNELEAELDKAGIILAAPINKLGSDADYCGIGEEHAEEGNFRGVTNAYYLGGGTGTADALKLNDELISFNSAKDWILKTWELADENGRSLENYASAKGIQTLYQEAGGTSGLNAKNILDLAGDGDTLATEIFRKVSEKLALLIYERIETLFSGWRGYFDFTDPNRKPLQINHQYLKTVFDKIIIGQRLARLFEQSVSSTILYKPFLSTLTELIVDSKWLDVSAKKHYLNKGLFRQDILVFSALGQAPVLGAGIQGWLAWNQR